jgi:formate/nitrite transporter FocA (FNT family)
VPVTLGNIIGGAVFVAFAYWYVHLRGEKRGARGEKNG